MPLKKQKAIKLIKEFLKELNKKKWYINIKPHIKAILLYGSVAKGTNREDSDIDILIFVPLKIEKKYTKGEYFYEFKDRQMNKVYEMNIVLRSIERLRKIKNDKFQKEVFRISVIVWDSDGEVRKTV